MSHACYTASKERGAEFGRAGGVQQIGVRQIALRFRFRLNVVNPVDQWLECPIVRESVMKPVHIPRRMFLLSMALFACEHVLCLVAFCRREWSCWCLRRVGDRQESSFASAACE